MKREIKFRAWDNYRKKMMFDFVVSDGSDGGVTSSVYLNQALDCSDYEIMQSTGLTDKNGVEIYEFDLVSLQINNFKSEPLYKIVFENGCFCLYHTKLKSYDGNFLKWGNIDRVNEMGFKIVIDGNIYEHKHLLQ